MTDAMDQMDITTAATAMAERSKFIRQARQKAGKDPEQVHDPVRASSSRIVDGKEPDSSKGVPSTPPPAATEPAPSGGDNQPASPKSAQEPPASQVRDTVRVKVGDRELDMPVDLLGSYIEKAQRAETAIQEAETLKRVKATDDAVALAVSSWAKTATPAQMRQLQAVLQGQRQVPVSHGDPEIDDEPDQASGNGNVPDALREQLMPYLQATEQLVAREKARQTAELEQNRSASVDTLMARYECFRDAGLKGLALLSIKAKLAAEPNRELTEVVAEHAAAYGNFHRERLSSKPAAGSQSPATPDQKDPGAASRPLTGRDLMKGGVLSAVHEYLRNQR